MGPVTREMLHTRRCLGLAMINAVENLRDTEGMSDLDFTRAMQSGEVYREAVEYLYGGWLDCSCPR